MEFVPAIKAGFQKYFDFDSRSSRSEYWWWSLFVFLGGFVLGLLDGMFGVVGVAGLGLLGALFTLVTFIPGISVSVRRLHDLDKSGWWLLLVFVPLIGWIVLIIWYCTRGGDEPNRFGVDPLAVPEEV